MAKKRKFTAYRRLDARPYTRISKFRKKSFVRVRPNSKVVRFIMGSKAKSFPVKMTLSAKTSLQIRHNAIEAGRQSANKFMETNLGKQGYRLQIMIYPHHIYRENPLASGAGADRMSTGMKMSFGKPKGVAARVKQGQGLVAIHCEKKDMPIARAALKRFQHKFPCSCSISEEAVA